MRNFIIANGFALILLVLIVNAKSEVTEGPDSKSADLEQYVRSLIKSESEKSARLELAILQKPMLLKENAATNEADDQSSMKLLKLFPESEHVSKHESAEDKVTSANDNMHNKTVSPPILPLLLQNDSTLAHHDSAIDSPTTHTPVLIKNMTNLRLPITYQQTKKLTAKANSQSLEPTTAHFQIPETPEESSTLTSDQVEQITIGPIDLDVVTDIVNSMLLGTSDTATTEVVTESFTEVAITTVLIIDDLANDGIDQSITEQPQPQTSTRLFAETTMDNPLPEAIAALDNLEQEATTALLQHSSHRPVDRFDFCVNDANSHIPCILMRMNVTLSVSYETQDQKYTMVGYQLPNHLIISGQCGNETSSMTLSWDDEKSPIAQQSNITLNFVQDHSSFYVNSVHVNIALDSHNFPNAKDAYISGHSSTNLKLFSTPVQNAVHICSAETKVTCGNIVATISNVTLIAYNDDQELSMRKEQYCNTTSVYGQEVSVASIIGGIVGAVIALALIVTLFSWCRRRSDISLRSELP